MSDEEEIIEVEPANVDPSSDVLMISDTPFFHPVVSKDDLTIGVRPSTTTSHHGFSEVRPVRTTLTRDDLTRELKEFSTGIVFQPPAKKRGRPPKSLFLQHVDPSPKPTHIMVTRSSRTFSSHF